MSMVSDESEISIKAAYTNFGDAEGDDDTINVV